MVGGAEPEVGIESRKAQAVFRAFCVAPWLCILKRWWFMMKNWDVTDRSVLWSFKTAAELGSSRPQLLAARTVAREDQARILQGWAQYTLEFAHEKTGGDEFRCLK